MKVSEFTVQLAAAHSAERRSDVRESLRAWVGDRRPDFEGRAREPGGGAVPVAPRIALSDRARTAQAAEAAPAAGEDDAQPPATEDIAMSVLRALTEMLTGRKVKVFDPRELHAGRNRGGDAGDRAQPAPTAERAGFGIEYDRVERIAEREQMSFQASGTVRTAAGTEIRFDLSMSLKREFVAESRVSLRAGDAVMKDPLVLNFDGQGARLDGERMSFDIDADGQADQIARLAAGSGYLVLDRNRNGTVDDGGELFGPSTGDGFRELARYDGDGNGWIDEADPVFDQLSVWRPGGGLQRLGAAGVGALYLGQVATPYALNDAGNDKLGALRASGIFVSEDGSAGVVQQVDLAV